MVKYTLKRLLHGIITVFIIATVVFLLMRMLPTDYFFTEEQLMKFTDQQKEAALNAAGLLDPITEQLGRFYLNTVKGDFGISRRLQAGQPVVKVIGQKFAISTKLGVVALSISLVLGVIMGIIQTVKKDRIPDHIGTAYTVFVNSVPHLVSYSLILAFGSRVLNFPAIYSSRSHTILSCVLPVTCLCLTSIAGYGLWTRRYMVDELNKDYIKLAKVKGLSSRQIMVKHILKNAFVPLAQYLPLSFLETIGGSLLVERFFSVPGMGPLLTDAINRYDLNVVQTLVIFYAVIGVLGVFLGDILMMIIDPRIKLADREGVR